MKRMISMLLALVLLLSGCGGGTAAQESQEAKPETVAVETTAAPTTEPTLSPEEVLYNSLSDRMKQAVEAGLVELEQLEDLNRTVTVGEAAAMLQKAYVHRTGVESKALNELMNTPDYADRTADRGWVLTVPGVTDIELTQGDQYENYQQWLKRLNAMHTEELWYGFDDRFGIETFSFIADDVVGRAYRSYPADAVDWAEYAAMMGEGSLYGPANPSFYTDVYQYACEVYDITTGKRYFALEDGCVNPTKALTVEDAAEYALKFYNYPNPMGLPEFVAPEEVGKYNTDIITADLLAKETDLPAASCQKLPSNWHGVVLKDMGYTMRTTLLDTGIYEYEIKAIKDAGFNFIGLELDFSWLQEAVLQNSEFDQFKGLVPAEDVGKFSVERLEQLDRVIALCMKYDIHVDLRCVSLGGWSSDNRNFGELSMASTGDKLAVWWQAIARRYADIPNEYLSFTLFTSAINAISPTVDALMPSVEAIRAVSPDRCIIADMMGWRLTKADAETFAQAGVALSSRIGSEENLKMFYHKDFYSYKQVMMFNASGESFVKNFQWPCNGVDAEALLSSTKKDRVYETMAVAEEYGVGFMVSEFGIAVFAYDVYNNGNWFYTAFRYPDESYRAMLEDITSTVEAKGYGWCFTNWYGYFGVTNGFPMYENATYEQVGDYPYYIDTAMYGWFQEINGVA